MAKKRQFKPGTGKTSQTTAKALKCRSGSWERSNPELYQSRWKTLDKKGIVVDDLIPLLVVIFIAVVAIMFLTINGAVNKEKLDRGIQEANNNLLVVDRVENFLNQEVSFGGESIKMIDLMATANIDENEKIDFLENQVDKNFDIFKTWTFGLYFNDEDILGTGSVIFNDKGISCGKDFEYAIKFPHGKIEFLCTS